MRSILTTMLLLTLVAATSVEAGRRAKVSRDWLPPGERVDLSEVVALDSGKPLDQTHYSGAVLVLELWGTWCLPCVRKMPAVQQAAEALMEDPEVRFLALNVGKIDKRASTARFVARRGWTLPIAFDETGSLSYSLSEGVVPHTAVVRADGTLCTRLGPSGATGYLEVVRHAVEGCRDSAEQATTGVVALEGEGGQDPRS